MRTAPGPSSFLLIACALCLTLAGCGGTRTVSVSASTLAGIPAGNSFEIDLTRSGTIYTFDGPDIDFARVSVRTRSGVRSFGDLLKESNTALGGRVTLGTPGDMRDHLPGKTGGTTQFDCGVFCKCDDTTDCVNLILSDKCGDDLWCSSTTESCFCTAKA